MVRAPSIKGRPTPERKYKSSASVTSVLPTRAPVSKALKRARKRADLLRKTQGGASEDALGDDEHRSARALLVTNRRAGQQPSSLLSKSALRRRKRKARDELAKDESQGREGGVKDLAEAVDELEEEFMEEQSDVPPVHAGTKGGRVTQSHRKRVLEQEQQRQKAVLANAAYQQSPFAALRQHLRTSMGHESA